MLRNPTLQMVETLGIRTNLQPRHTLEGTPVRSFAIVEPAIAALGVTLMVGWLLMFGGVTHFLKGSGAKRVVLQVLAGMVYFTGFVCADLARAARQTAAGDLAGTSWQLVKFEGSDDRTLTPERTMEYTIAFETDGTVSVRIDCNRGHGTWKSGGPNQLEFGPLALTRAMCPPAPLNDRLAKDWQYVRSYLLKHGHLFVSLMADAGIYEFEPIRQQRQGEGRVQGTATYRERMALPASAVFEAVLEDVSKADGAAEVIARTRIEHPGYPPIRFEIIYEPAKIEQHHDYSVRARIIDGDRIVFTTVQSYLVLTRGNGNKVRLLLSRSAVPPAASSAPSESLLSVLPATFVGVLPCADCPGIRYQLNLFPDHTFLSRMTYEERDGRLGHHGHWQLASKGKMLVLQGEDKSQEKFEVRDVHTLRKLDVEGHEIESKLNYDLKRTAELEPIEPQSLTTATALLENTDWKLTSLGDVPITSVLQQKPHFVLNSESRRVSGSGGCNQLTGSYELKNDHLTFSQMATTMMACAEGMDTEKAFLKVLTEAKTWKMAGGELELLNDAGSVIARFEARDSNSPSSLTGCALTETWQPQPVLSAPKGSKPELLAWSGATCTIFQAHQAFPGQCSTKRNLISEVNRINPHR